ncbi:MAG: DUF11 domain-containing protein [Betaproteobacteria bacterium]|nr:DUF11 domain-containing protein [Betaproteobacteria bacterium]MDE2122283.1 DUF11 domain-containing protein [Betaproteobacteria bacterium]MDE2187231.1 DUF11 domain-containing protein [Betaproteobacteria bacterium]MDE2323429.1 DUF11 domain-containing protein [Betaproteobacteria bacterium]
MSPVHLPVVRNPLHIVRGLVLALLLSWSALALAAGGSYATAGTGTFAQSLWWLDFTGYDNTAAGGAAGQAFTFTLPNGAGTLTTSVQRSQTGTGTTMAAVAEPAWTGGGAFGHGAYNGITGLPIFYWLGQTGNGTITLANMVMRDAAGNARSFAFYAADGENTNAPESIVYASTANWSLIDSVNYYASFNGGNPTLAGTGSTQVTETGPATNDNNYNGSIVLGTLNPTQVSATFSGNEASLFALSLPTINLNLNIAGRLSPADQFTANIGYTSPAAAISNASTSGTATTATTGADSVIGTNSVTLSVAMATGSTSSLTYYTSSISCSNAGPGASTFGGTNTVLPGGAGTSFALTPQTGDAITCTLTLTPKPQGVSGTVYNDTNHNANLDAGESGTGVAGLYVKLAPSSGGVCQSPATAAAAVNTTTGAYSLPNVAPGTYCLILDGNNTLSDITASRPAGWIGTQKVSGIIQLAVAGAPPPPQNFGLYNGASLTGTVFNDTGAGAGTANNGVQDGSEAGMANVVVNTSAGAGISASTAGNGGYTLWIPASTTGTLTITPAAPSGSLATGGSAGTTGGSYTRPNVSFTPAAGNTYSGVNFGLAPGNTLGPNGAQAAQPGTTVFYAHTFTAGSGGQVTFSLSNSAAPSSPAWSQVLYQDSNCNAVLDAGEPQITAPITVTAGQKICLIVKQFVPAGAAAGAQNSVTLNAAFNYTNANPALASNLTAQDITTVGQPGALALSKLVSNLTQGGAAATAVSANPGDALQYALTAVNNGTQALSTLVVSDATPAFTTFVSAACPATLPSGISACSVSTQPAAGASGSLRWTFTGSLAPSARLTVTYQVKVNQ